MHLFCLLSVQLAIDIACLLFWCTAKQICRADFSAIEVFYIHILLLLLTYKSLLIKRVNLSETCCTHWVDVMAEMLVEGLHKLYK